MQKPKKRGKFSGFVLWQFHLCYFRGDLLVLFFTATLLKVTTTIAVATEMSAALLNSGTFGVEVGLAVAEVPVLDVAVEVGLEPLEELDGSDITARLPMKPSVEPGLLTA